MLNLKKVFFVMLCIRFSPLSAQYIHRHTEVAVHGQMTFTGNTLGLSKKANENDAGTEDSIGAYITLDASQKVGNFPPGTTLDYTQNSAAAVLDISGGSEILYAELIWAGSYGYYKDGQGEDPDKVLIPANGPVKFTTPLGQTYEIMSDPATRQNIQNNDPKITYPAGNYTRSQNVTEIVKNAGGGAYAAGGVASTISGLDNTHNAAGWTLAVIYKHPDLDIHNMSIFVGCEQASTPENPAEVTGFITPLEGRLSGRLLVCGIEGDANKTGDHMGFGPTPTNLTYLLGPNNKINDFFSSQINGDDGLIDKSGTFGDRNHVPPKRISAGRQGYDITNVDCSNTLYHGQTSAYAQGVTSVGGEDYTINALGIQILVEAPIIEPIKKVNGVDDIESRVGDTVTFSVNLTNTGSVTANDVMLRDDLEQALMPVAGSCKVNGIPYANPDYSRGILIGDLAVNETAVVEFKIKIDDYPEVGNMYENTVNVDYVFRTPPPARSALFARASNLGDMHFQAFSNTVTIVLPAPFAPGVFTGTLKKCKFLGKTEYSITSTWTLPEETGVLFYRIYDRDKVIGEIPSGFPRVFDSCLISKSQGKRLEVAAVYDNFAESIHVPIQIID